MIFEADISNVSFGVSIDELINCLELVGNEEVELAEEQNHDAVAAIKTGPSGMYRAQAKDRNHVKRNSYHEKQTQHFIKTKFLRSESGAFL